MERILPYRREWNRSHGDLRTDSFYFLTQIFVGGLLAPVLAALTIIIGGWLSARMGGSLWPYSWPILAQMLLASAVLGVPTQVLALATVADANPTKTTATSILSGT
jgi:hypothetical protein